MPVPITLRQRHGVEDLRRVRFVDDDGHATYLGTYTAFSGEDIRSELLRTTDFATFEMNALRGVAAGTKGLALFPRSIGGRYAMVGRLEEMVLKVAMVLPGLTCPDQPDPATIAEATLASARLNAIHLAAGRQIPTPLSFSFARAIQQPALELWRGDDRQVAAAQAVLAHRAQCNRAARRGDYLAAMEHTS